MPPEGGEKDGTMHGSEQHAGSEHAQHKPMMERGVTRPMTHSPGDHGEMTRRERHEMQAQHHRKTLWVYYLVIVLGFWLISSPFTNGYQNLDLVSERTREITDIRSLPDIATRAAWITWSDVLSGAALVVLGALSLNPRRLWAPWAASVVGFWLLLAPLVLWSPHPAAYYGDSLIGALVIALTILIPGMPGMILIMKHGPEVPPGWSYNPSSWLQRAPIIALAWGSFFLARHMAAYQFGYSEYAWDPLFGGSTMRILDSDVSLAWPISDAGLGAVAYALEALMGYMGSTQRWRTMPWMVLFFGILVVPLGVVSIALVIMQPVAVGAWCTLCLVTALAMLLMIPLTLDEVVAMVQFMVKAKRQGKSLWRTFWLGGTVEGGGQDERSPTFTAPINESGPAMIWGVTVPWNLLASALIGAWVMAAQDLFGAQKPIADSDVIGGALVVTLAVVAMAEVARPVRYLNVLLGLWLIISPWLLAGATDVTRWSDIAAGAALIALSLPRGPIRETYGDYDRYIR